MEENQTEFKRWLINIWPSIYKKINAFFYWLVMLIRKTVQLAFDQIK